MSFLPQRAQKAQRVVVLSCSRRMESSPFRKLIVWQKAMDLVRMVYRKSKDFPLDERYALTDQLRRAVVSIPSNIAEGSGRASNKDYAHFCRLLAAPCMK